MNGELVSLYIIYIYTSIYILRVYRKSNGVGGGRRRLSRLTGVDRTRGFHVIMTSCLNSKPDMCRGRTRVRNVPRSHQRPRFLYVEKYRGYLNVCLDLSKGFDRKQNTNDISDSVHLVKSNLIRTWLYSDFCIGGFRCTVLYI